MTRKGQSLLEAIIALSILTVGFLGIASLLSRSFFLNRMNANEVTGTYLAAEGIEVMKNLLDHDYYGGSTWGTCGGACVGNGSYIADYTTGTSIPGSQPLTLLLNGCSGPGYNPLRFSTSTGAGLYSYSASSKPSIFYRCIRISHTIVGTAYGEVTVDSIVTWSTGLVAQSAELEDHFYNWHP